MNLMKSLKNFGSEKNFNTLVGLFSVLVALWILFYALPNFFYSLFNTILGNLILILLVVLVGIKNIAGAVILFIIFIVLYKLSNHMEEGFSSTKKNKNKKPHRTTKMKQYKLK